MSEVPAPRIALPRQHGAVTVRQGGLDDDLDALHVGDPLWWGQNFLAGASPRARLKTPG